jgi:ATP-dependent Clp protease protease subunit
MASADWSDARRRRLRDERVVSITRRLDETLVTDLAAELWSLDALGDEPITILCSIDGGTIAATATLLDVLDVIGVDIHLVCVGAIVGPPVALLAGATRRLAAPHARLVLRDGREEFRGSYRDLEESAARFQAQRRQLFERLAESTGGRRSLGDVLADFERGLGLSAEEALRYGIIDEIATTRSRVVPLPRPAPGFGFSQP